MKKLSAVFLFTVLFLGAHVASAQLSAEDVTKQFNKVKGQYDNLMGKWKPYQDLAMANMDKLSPELKTSIDKLNTSVSDFGRKMSAFPTSSVEQQASMIPTLQSDYTNLKTQVSSVSKAIKALKLPKL